MMPLPGLNITIINQKDSPSPLEEALRDKEEEKDDEKHGHMMSMLEMMLKKLDRIPRTGTFHGGGGGC